MRKQKSKLNELNKTFLFAKKSILVLIAIFFIILLFLLLLPKEPDIIKGVTYDLKYPKTAHYSQIPPEVFEKDFKLMKEAGCWNIMFGIECGSEKLLKEADKGTTLSRAMETVSHCKKNNIKKK